jgi:hypothetical protein
MVADARKPLPLMSLVKLDINFRRVAVKDVTRPDSAPLALEDFRLRNLAPILLGGADPESQAPAQLQLTGHVTPIIGAFDIKATTAPLLSDSSLAVDVAVSGIRGDGLTELLPELKSHLNGGSLVDGRFKTHVEAHAKFERRGPRDIDFSRPFQLDLGITGTEFRADESGPVLAGVEAFHAEQTRIEPRTGSVMARLIEIGTPQARLWREADGLHALGLVIPLPKAATTMPSESATPQTAPPAQASAPAAKPGSEIRVDHLILSGLDFEYQDRAVTPPFDLPLNNLEIEARDLTTRMLTEICAIFRAGFSRKGFAAGSPEQRIRRRRRNRQADQPGRSDESRADFAADGAARAVFSNRRHWPPGPLSKTPRLRKDSHRRNGTGRAGRAGERGGG